MRTDSEIEARSAEAGLTVSGIERRGAVLVLRTASLDALPPADALRELAATLRGDGVHWVALDLDEAP